MSTTNVTAIVLSALSFALPTTGFAENPWRALECPPGSELQQVTEHMFDNYSGDFYAQSESCVNPLTDNLEGEVRISNSRDGVVSLSTYQAGFKHGPEWTFHKNEQLHGAFIYERSKLNGPISVFRNNGLPELTGEYTNSRQVGVWQYFDEQGQLEREKNFGQ